MKPCRQKKSVIRLRIGGVILELRMIKFSLEKGFSASQACDRLRLAIADLEDIREKLP